MDLEEIKKIISEKVEALDKELDETRGEISLNRQAYNSLHLRETRLKTARQGLQEAYKALGN